MESGKDYPKILFLTLDGWNNTTGTATISSIIEGYPPEKVASVFIRSDYPNSKCCSRYFHISEFAVFKSILKRNIKTGREVFVKDTDDAEVKGLNKEKQSQNSLKKYKNAFTPFLRDLAWKVGKWKSKELKEFVLDFNPDLIIFPAEGLVHFNKIGRYLSKLTKAPIGLFFWDDNFTYKVNKGFLNKLYRYFNRSNIKKAIKSAKLGFSINPKIQRECEEELGMKTVLLTKPMNETEFVERSNKRNDIIKILYTGNLYIDRDKTILTLIDAIKEVNRENPKFFLDIYTNSALNDNEKQQFNIEDVSRLNKGVTKEKVLKLQQNTDILLFAEALDGKHRNAARLSFSTKLVEYFSAGRLILAIAPKDIAPTEYLKENDIALIAGTKEELLKCLKIIQEEVSVIDTLGRKTFDFGTKNHNKEKIYHDFLESVKGIVKG